MNVPAPHVPPPTRQSSPLAVISLICGILSWLGLPVVAGLVAVITGHMARREIRREPERYEGDTLALIGLVLGYINLALAVLGILFAILAFLFWGSLALIRLQALLAYLWS